MFKDVQRLMVVEAEAKLQALKAEKDAMYDEVRNLKFQMAEAENKYANYEWQKKNGMKAFRGAKISMLKRLLSPKARHTYQAYQKALAEMRALQNKLAVLPTEIEIAEMQTKHAVVDSGIDQKIEAAEHDYYHKDRAQCLSELGLNPAEAVELLENNDITPLLDESDYIIFERPREYENKGKSAMCAVHKMDLMPENNRLSTLKEAGVMQTDKVQINDQEYEYSYLLERDTVHLSINDEVSSHMYGNWDRCHYCVLQPLAEIPNQKIGSLEPNDTYTRGGVELTNHAWILCPASEVETVKELNPRVHVLGYQAENVKDLAAPFLSQLGFRAESVNSWGWNDYESEQQFYRVAERENLPVVQHTDSTDLEDEEFNIGANKTIALVQMLVKTNLVHSVADLTSLESQLNAVCFDIARAAIYKRPNPCRHESQTNQHAIVANRRNIEVLAEKMQQAGMPLSMTDQVALQARIDGRTNNPMKQTGEKQIPLYQLIEQAMVNSALHAREMEADRTL